MTPYDLMALILSTIALSYSGVASFLQGKRVEQYNRVLSSGTPSDTLLKRVETEFRDMRLRVEKTEAHWEEMYAKFDRLQKAEKQRDRRSAASAELPLEPPLEEVEQTREQKLASLRNRIRTGHGN